MDTAQKVIGSAAVKQQNSVTIPILIGAIVVVVLFGLLTVLKTKGK
jgi:hypothetical protein